MQEQMQYDARRSWRIDGKKNILVLESGDHPVLPYQVNMLQYNEIEGILPMQFYIEDNQYKYFYDVTSMDTVALKMEHKKYEVSDIRTILTALYKTVSQMEEFLLDIKCLILLPEYIFVKNDTGQIYFCYYPDQETAFQESLEFLMEIFMNHISYEEEEAVNLVYGMYQKLKKDKEPLGELLKEFCLKEEKREYITERKEEAEGNPEYMDTDACSEQDAYSDIRLDHSGNKGGNKGEKKQHNCGKLQNNTGKMSVSAKIVEVLIDLAGAGAIAALVLYMMKYHERLSVSGFIIWFASVSVMLFGSSAVSWRWSEKHRKSCDQLKESVSVTNVSYDENDQKTEYAGSEEEKNGFDSFCNPGEEDSIPMTSEEYEEPESHYMEMQFSDDENQYFNETPSMEEKVKKRKFREEMDESGNISENVLSEMKNSRGMNQEGMKANEMDKSPIPKTEKLSHRDSIPATVIMKIKETSEVYGILESLKKGKVQDIIIDEEELLIGKVPGVADICLKELCVSRMHAMIGQSKDTDKNFYIRDLGSTNGTYVNGVRVRQSQEKHLKEGDIVRLADIEYQFKIKKRENDTQIIGIGV